ncbi:MAG: pyridoxal phosphate-dependent aminotransferase [Candidatus Eisenbacteria bacterium]|nr:pyridoxal phosphate-dependent aminotransferase [Candidatus Eisenbacteria bacterium]
MITFSRRTGWPAEPNRLSEAWAHCRAVRPDAVDLTLSNPTAAGLPYPEEAILRALSDPRALLYEPASRGLPSALEALARDLTRAADAVSPDHLVLTASTSEAYGWLFKLLTERGDEILVPRPSYPLLEFLADLEETRLVSYPLRYDGRWQIDFDALEAACTERTRAVVVIHPNNPTGNFLDLDDARRLGEICARRGLAILSDEVFLEYGLGSANELRAGTLAALDLPTLTVSLGGLSKCAALPQIKVGWMRVGGPSALAREALSRLEVIADTYLSVNTPAQWGLETLLATRSAARDAIRARIESNDAALRSTLGPQSPISALHTEGGWSTVLRLPRVRSEEAWTLGLLEEEAIQVHPGYFFDFDQEAYWVVSLLPRPEQFVPAIERALRYVERHA